MTVTIIGNVNVDLVMGPQAPWPQPGTEVVLATSDLRVGGAAGNAALALDALGAPHRIVASRGDDVFGTWLADPFGPRAAAWPAAGGTTVSVGITHPDGERTFFTSPGHLDRFGLDAVLPQLPEWAAPGEVALLVGVFVLPALLPAYGDLIASLRRRGFAVALDTGWPSGGWTEATRMAATGWLAGCDHLVINEIEAHGLSGRDHTEDAARALAASMAPGASVVVKRGPQGALARRGAEVVRAAAPSVRVVDTIGAGDAFDAGYLAAATAGASLRRAVEAGVAVASLAISTSPRRYAAA